VSAAEAAPAVAESIPAPVIEAAPAPAPVIAEPEPAPAPTAAAPAPAPAQALKLSQTVGELFGQPNKQNWTPADLVKGIAFPLPAAVISELIGAPHEDAERFKDWSDDLALVAFGAGGERGKDRHARAQESIEEMFVYFGELIERKRAEPGDDMISSLIEGEDGDALDETEMKGMCALMLFAGHETTTTTITSAVKVLIDNPEQLQLLRDDPAQAGKCVEEVLRYEGAIKLLHRWVLDDLEIRGRQIKAGERVLIVNSAANRDPLKFDEPDAFRIMRHPNAHVAFGKGIHACIGAMLARIEMRVAVRRMVERLPGLRYADPDPVFRWNSSLASRGLAELRIAHDGQG